jgi:hypothetical protein
MAPKKKPIRELTPEETKALTGDEVMDRIFGKRVRKKLQKAAGKEPTKPSR